MTTSRQAPGVEAGDDREVIRPLGREPGASAAEVDFTATTELTYWRDSVVQTEHKAAEAAAGGRRSGRRVTWRTPSRAGVASHRT